jgi:transcriptional regulator with XRE-family HTH domain
MREWLIEKRRFCKMTQKFIATETGISTGYYTLIELGQRRPSPNVAQKISTILQFDWKLFFE